MDNIKSKEATNQLPQIHAVFLSLAVDAKTEQAQARAVHVVHTPHGSY